MYPLRYIELRTPSTPTPMRQAKAVDELKKSLNHYHMLVLNYHASMLYLLVGSTQTLSSGGGNGRNGQIIFSPSRVSRTQPLHFLHILHQYIFSRENNVCITFYIITTHIEFVPDTECSSPMSCNLCNYCVQLHNIVNYKVPKVECMVHVYILHILHTTHIYALHVHCSLYG